MSNKKNILLCLTGGIALYKCLELASLLVKKGFNVKTIMTESAQEFVKPLSFQSLTKQPVATKLFNVNDQIEHISLSDWADLIAVVPATANIIGKLANGIADDLLTTTVMAANCPVLIVPAMNDNMYNNAIVQSNLAKLIANNYFVLEPDEGLLACGTTGKGRLPEVEEIIYAIRTYLSYKLDLTGKKILVTAGSTVEKIDAMRFISNNSSGKTGLSIARACYLRGADVLLIHAALSEPIPYYLNRVSAISAYEMYKACLAAFDDYDIVIMCAAISDFTIKNPLPNKMKKDGKKLIIKLEPTLDILKHLGKIKKHQKLIGFAAETDYLLPNARKKMKSKKLDFIVANDLNVAGRINTDVTILRSDCSHKVNIKGDKFDVAHEILSNSVGNAFIRS